MYLFTSIFQQVVLSTPLPYLKNLSVIRLAALPQNNRVDSLRIDVHHGHMPYMDAADHDEDWDYQVFVTPAGIDSDVATGIIGVT